MNAVQTRQTRTPPAREYVFESSGWQNDHNPAPVKYLTVTVTQEHIKKGAWRRFSDPVCLAINEQMADKACATIFWNSDSWYPRYPGDDARLGFSVEAPCPETGMTREYSYWLPLNRRAENFLKKLYWQGEDAAQGFSFRIPVPLIALPK